MPSKITVAVPCGELARYPDFWHNLFGAIQGLPPRTQWAVDKCAGTYISEQQNHLARQFLKTDSDFFWLTNDDQVYPQGTLPRLLAHNVPVVIPVCLGKSHPFKPLLYDRDDGTDDGFRVRCLNDNDKGLVPIIASGGGGMLIRRDVLEKIPDPWWEVRTARPKDDHPGQMSEDITFCRKVREAGFEIVCDTDCVIGHQAVFTIWPYRDPTTKKWSTAVARHEQPFMLPAATESPPAESP